MRRMKKLCACSGITRGWHCTTMCGAIVFVQSEGKDSRVLGHLMRRAGVRHFYMHSVTGIDPPELVYFQRANFQAYRDLGYLTYDVMYQYSMWQLMRRKKIPPLRKVRYCCEHLKERPVPQQGRAILSLGVRKYESVGRRKKRDELEIASDKKRGDNIIMPFDNSEKRRIFETCYQDNQRRINPLAYWTDSDIWSYSKDVGLEQCSLYDEGFSGLVVSAAPWRGAWGVSRSSAAGQNSRRSICARLATCWRTGARLACRFWNLPARRSSGLNGG